MEKNIPKIKMSFIRHGEHDQNNPVVDKNQESLTQTGYNEAKTISSNINPNMEQAVVFSPNLKRSILTTMLSIDPLIEEHDLDSALDLFIKKKKIKIDNTLTYKSAANSSDFKKELDEAVQANKVFEFMVYDSDFFKKEVNLEITTYTDMVKVVAENVYKYMNEIHNWNKISQKYEDKNLYRIFCPKEYFYPCFRSEMTRLVLGTDAQHEYVKWYSENMQSNNLARLESQNIEITEKLLQIKDSYGELVFYTDQLLEILNNQNMSKNEIIFYNHKRFDLKWIALEDMNSKLENILTRQCSGYFFDKDRNLLLVKKKNGHWSIPGGKPEIGETNSQTLIRELAEESSQNCSFLKEIGLVLVKDEDDTEYLQRRFFGLIDKKSNFEAQTETNEIKFVAINEIEKYISYFKGLTFQAELKEALRQYDLYENINLSTKD